MHKRDGVNVKPVKLSPAVGWLNTQGGLSKGSQNSLTFGRPLSK